MLLFVTFSLPCNRLFVDIVELVDAFFADQLLQFVSRDSNQAVLDGPAVPEVVELGLVPANDFRGRTVVAL